MVIFCLQYSLCYIFLHIVWKFSHVIFISVIVISGRRKIAFFNWTWHSWNSKLKLWNSKLWHKIAKYELRWTWHHNCVTSVLQIVFLILILNELAFAEKSCSAWASYPVKLLCSLLWTIENTGYLCKTRWWPLWIFNAVSQTNYLEWSRSH